MTSPRPLLLARLLAIGTTLTAACGGIETRSTGEQTGSPGGGAGEGGSSGSPGQGGAGGTPAQGGTTGVSGQGDAAGQGVGGQGGAAAGGAAGSGPAAGGPAAGGSAGAGSASGTGGSGALPVCDFPPPCVDWKGLCYPRGDEEACAAVDSPAAWARLGCEIAAGNGAYLHENGAECCYTLFCGEGRPLYVDGLRTRAPSRRRGDWG